MWQDTQDIRVKDYMCVSGVCLANDKILISTQSSSFLKIISDNAISVSEINILHMQIHSHGFSRKYFRFI